MSEQEFVATLVQHQSRIFRYIAALVPQRHDADDVLQAVSITLWQRREDFDPEAGSFAAWALGVARNHVRNNYQKQTRQNRRVVLNEALIDEFAATRIANERMLDERVEALHECLERLPAEWRYLIEQHYYRQEDMHNIADVLHLSRNTLYRRMAAIRESLMRCVTRRVRSETPA